MPPRYLARVDAKHGQCLRHLPAGRWRYAMRDPTNEKETACSAVVARANFQKKWRSNLIRPFSIFSVVLRVIAGVRVGLLLLCIRRPLWEPLASVQGG